MTNSTPVSRKQHTHTQRNMCVFKKCCICTLVCTQSKLPACMSDIFVCVLQTNHPYIHINTRWGKGVAAESRVIYRCASSERGRRTRGGEREQRERLIARQAKVKGEKWAEWSCKPPDSLWAARTCTETHLPDWLLEKHGCLRFLSLYEDQISLRGLFLHLSHNKLTEAFRDTTESLLESLELPLLHKHVFIWKTWGVRISVCLVAVCMKPHDHFVAV